MISPDQLVPAHILNLRPYEPGLNAEQIKERYGLKRVIKLASNENPLGTSPKAVERAREALLGMARYPDGGIALRHALAERFRLRVREHNCGIGQRGHYG